MLLILGVICLLLIGFGIGKKKKVLWIVGLLGLLGIAISVLTWLGNFGS